MSEQNACGEPVPVTSPENPEVTQTQILVPAPALAAGTPPKRFERNEYGLIADGSVNYVFNDDGTINWRKMIKPEFLVPNKQKLEQAGKEVPKTIEGLEDKYLLILLGGIKELAQTRGFVSSSPSHIVSPSNDYVVVGHVITWIPNYETENRSITSSGIGDASPFNTNSFGKSFLGPIAENRAFVRCVRNFLKINVVGQDEVPATGLSPEAETMDVSGDLLSTTMAQFGVSWEKIKAALAKENFPDVEKLSGVSDLPKFKQFELIERIKKKASKEKKEKS